MEKLELDVALNAKQYYHFNLYHCYHSFNGFLGTFLGIFCMIYGIAGCFVKDWLTTAQIVMFILFGILLLFYNPVALYVRSKRRFLTNPVMKNPVKYIFSKTGIMLRQGEVEEEMAWENLHKIIKTRESMIFFLTRFHANIIPLSEMGDQYEQVCDMIEKYADAGVVKFKR